MIFNWRPTRRIALLATSGMTLFVGAARANDATTVSQVVVTPTAGEQKLADAPATISVVTRQDLEARPVQDLADALRGQPGVNVGGIGMTRRGISLRGMPVEHTLMLVDGRRLSAVGGLVAHGDYDLAWTPVEAIERIEIVRGPMSSLYGADALGGVVNVITRSATDAWRGSATINGSSPEGGEGKAYQFGGYVGGPLVKDKLGLSVYADATGRNPTFMASDPRQAELEGRRSVNGSATLSWTPDTAQRIDLTYSAGHDVRYRDTVTTAAPITDYRFSDDIDREQLALSHTGKWSWGDTSLRAYRSELKRVNIRTKKQTPSSPVRIVERVLDGHVSVQLGDHRVNLGGDLRRQSLRNPEVNASGRASADQGGAFIQDEWSVTERWSIVGGARFDRHEAYDWQTSPRLYTVFHATSKLTLKGGVGRGFKAPSLTQLSPEYDVVAAGGRFTVYGNPNLKPEIGTTYEASVDYDAGPWSVRAAVFQNDLKNLVETQCTAFCGIRGREVRLYGNVSRARIKGVEAGASAQLPAAFKLSANYTHLDTENRATGAELTERPRNSLNARLEWAPREDFSAQLRAEYVGRQLVSTGVLPDYSLWFFEAQKRLTPNVALRIGVENITDQRLAEKSSGYTYAEPGRLYHLGFNLSF